MKGRGRRHAIAATGAALIALGVPTQAGALDTAASAIGADDLWALGHTGGAGPADVKAVHIGLAGEVPDSTHPALEAFAIESDPFFEAESHGTHTAGILVSQDPVYRGIAFGAAKLRAGGVNWYTVQGERPVDVVSVSLEPVDSDMGTDGIQLAAPELGIGFAHGSGNTGPTIGSVGGGVRNELVVGAFDDGDTTAGADDVMWSGSSRGPTVAGRKQPDVVAPGVDVVSPSGFWEIGPDFNDFTGTSAATPIAAGAMALLEGAGVDDEKTQRALLVNSARTLPGELATWDRDSGWGAIDVAAAFDQADDTDAGAVRGGEAAFYAATFAPGDRASLVWNWRGEPGGASYYPLTNLDLRQYDRTTMAEIAAANGGQGAGPDATDTNDSVERVYAAGAGQVLLKVDAASAVASPPSSAGEPYAIASSAALEDLGEPLVRPQAPDVEPAPAVCGEAFTVSVDVANPSDDFDAAGAAATIALPAGLELAGGAATQSVSGGTLEEGASETVSWQLRHTAGPPRTETVTVTGTGGALGETFTRELQIGATCADPAPIAPVQLVATPSTTPVCGDPVTITARGQNDSPSLSADQATLSIAAAGATLTSGAATQEIASPVGPGASSVPVSWSLEASGPGSHLATVTGEGSTRGFDAAPQSASVSFACGPAYRAATSIAAKLRYAKRAIRVDGTAGAATGSVEITARAGKRRLVRLAPIASGAFRAVLRTCRPGRYVVSASYAGDDRHRPIQLVLGSVRLARACGRR